MIASSVVSFVIILSCMARFMEKASRTDGIKTLDDHEWCKPMLTALRDKDCTSLRTNLLNRTDCIGSPNLANLCPYNPPGWFETASFESPAAAYVYGCVMIFFSLLTSEFFLVICLLACFKGSDKLLKKKQKQIKKDRNSIKRGASKDVINDDSREEVITEKTAMIEATGNDRLSTGVRHTDLDQAVARIDFDDGFLNFKKGDRVQIVDLAPEHDMFWRVELGGNQGLVHKGFFQDIPDFVFEKCRALYDFDPEFDIEEQSGDELSFAHDDLMFVLEKPEGGSWWLAQIDDQVGWVPKDFLEKARQ